MKNILDTFKLDGYLVEVIYDVGMGPPWEECDGHGSVRVVNSFNHVYTGRTPKHPGERVLHTANGLIWLYDHQGAVKRAKREGWGSAKTSEEMLAAVEADFKYLQRWITSEWVWAIVSVIPTTLDGDALYTQSRALGGIQSDDDEYIREAAKELIVEIERDIEDEQIERDIEDEQIERDIEDEQLVFAKYTAV